jgi:hypothetical protein
LLTIDGTGANGIGIGAILPIREAAGDIVVLETFKMDAEFKDKIVD